MAQKIKLTRNGIRALTMSAISVCSGILGYGAYSTFPTDDKTVEITATTPPPKPATELLGDDLTAAINAEAEKQKAEAEMIPAVKKTCAEAVTTLNETLSTAGYSEKVTSDYRPPDEDFKKSYPAGFCAIYLNRDFVIAITEPNQFEDEFDRKYAIEKLIERLGPLNAAPGLKP